MKMPRSVIWIFVPLLVVAVAFELKSKALWSRFQAWSHPQAVVVTPTTLELGEREIGNLANARFRIANRGKADLIITQIRTSCSCSGVDREVDGKSTPVNELHLRPAEEAELVLRIVAGGRPGDAMRSRVTFATNDSRQPEVVLEAVISKLKGGVTPRPTTVVFGNLLPYTKATRLLELFDGTVNGRRIAKVTSSRPDRFEVRLLPAPPGQRAAPVDRALLGSRIALLEVTAKTNEARPLDGEIHIHLAGEVRSADVVPVIGRVVALAEVAPASLVLPRYSKSGPLNFAVCLFRAWDGKPLKVSLDETPGEISVDLLPAEGNHSLQKARIQWKAAGKQEPANGSQKIVQFRAHVGDREIVLPVSVLWASQGER